VTRPRVRQITDIRDIAAAIAAMEVQLALAEGDESPVWGGTPDHRAPDRRAPAPRAPGPQTQRRPAAGDAARLALRRIASGVTVLTINQDGLRHGATVSAIVAISRNPLVLGVCLRESSAFATMIEQARSFSVNVLAAGQTQLAKRFADPGRRPGDAQFTGLRWTTDQVTDAPLIDGCLAHLACRLTGSHLIGDHRLIVAEVITGTPGDGGPLVSFAGKLGKLIRDGGADPPAAAAPPPFTTTLRTAAQGTASPGNDANDQ
jgi:flavin reductase (DIM6/NTAB) family NADH-FMN oxidoreductase RutF